MSTRILLLSRSCVEGEEVYVQKYKMNQVYTKRPILNFTHLLCLFSVQVGRLGQEITGGGFFKLTSTKTCMSIVCCITAEKDGVASAKGEGAIISGSRFLVHVIHNLLLNTSPKPTSMLVLVCYINPIWASEIDPKRIEFEPGGNTYLGKGHHP